VLGTRSSASSTHTDLAEAQVPVARQIRGTTSTARVIVVSSTRGVDRARLAIGRYVYFERTGPRREVAPRLFWAISFLEFVRLVHRVGSQGNLCPASFGQSSTHAVGEAATWRTRVTLQSSAPRRSSAWSGYGSTFCFCRGFSQDWRPVLAICSAARADRARVCVAWEDR